ANYVLPTTGTGPGLINPAPLTISGLKANDKVYDGSRIAVLDFTSVSIFGIVGSDDVRVLEGRTTGSFVSKNVGNAVPVSGTAVQIQGASVGNYVVLQPTGLAANITPAALVVSGLTANDKVYDGTRIAALNTSGVTFTGLIPGDIVTPVSTGTQIVF